MQLFKAHNLVKSNTYTIDTGNLVVMSSIRSHMDSIFSGNAFSLHTKRGTQCFRGEVQNCKGSNPYQSFRRCHWATCWRGLATMSFQCRVSIGPLRQPRMTFPISSLRPTLSKSITETSSEASRIFSQGISKMNDSLYTGFRVRILMLVFFFSTLFPPNCSQIFTYGSETKSTIG